MSETWPTNAALHDEDQRLQGGLTETNAQINMLRREVEATDRNRDLDLQVIKANLASLNEIAALLTSAVAPGSPGLDLPARDTLRRLSFCLGFEFMGEPRPGDWDTPRELSRLLGETSDDEPDEPEIPGWDPGPEVDDEGGMSEYRYAIIPDGPAPGAAGTEEDDHAQA